MTFKAPSPPYLGPPSKHSGTGNKPINRIVLHGTVSATSAGGARRIATYFRSSRAKGSAHYVVDPLETIQTAWDDTVAWHAPPNLHSLGIELCDWVAADNGRGGPAPLSRWDDQAHRQMLGRAAKLTAQLCLAYDVPVVMLSPRQLRAGQRGICEHSDVSEAWGQSSHWDLGAFPRARFLALVRAEVAALRDGKDDPPRPAPQANNVTRARDLLTAAIRANTKRPKRRARLQHALDQLPER